MTVGDGRGVVGGLFRRGVPGLRRPLYRHLPSSTVPLLPDTPPPSHTSRAAVRRRRRYAENTSWLKRCFDYGLTNSIAVIHVWQRWGYDYRLPDIFPPLASLGTLEEMRELGATCTRAGALWAPHDHYIDIYPDADDFTYEVVTFHADGQPRKAWYNEGRKAQSYQFRPDRVRPFLERNLDRMALPLKPTSSFVDVWTSINAFDYHDRNGGFHSKTETLREWGEAFQLISRKFGNAPTISKAGSDQLIGWLEGADCQFLRISPGRESFTAGRE